MARKYDNPAKQTWRGWAWNQLQRRGVVAGSTVLVLAGDNAMDLAWAEKRGIHAIGVDFKNEFVKTYRRNGGIGICDNAHSQLFALKPDAVILDFTGGVTPKSLAFLRDCSRGCVAVIANFRRGQDTGYNPAGIEWIEKHRGRGALTKLVFNRMVELINDKNVDGDIHDAIISSLEDGSDEFILAMKEAYKPSYYSYKSQESKHSAYYDSIAISHPNPSVLKEIRDSTWCSDLGSKRKAAAAKALLTMRRNRN